MHDSINLILKISELSRATNRNLDLKLNMNKKLFSINYECYAIVIH